MFTNTTRVTNVLLLLSNIPLLINEFEAAQFAPDYARISIIVKLLIFTFICHVFIFFLKYGITQICYCVNIILLPSFHIYITRIYNKIYFQNN